MRVWFVIWRYDLSSGGTIYHLGYDLSFLGYNPSFGIWSAMWMICHLGVRSVISGYDLSFRGMINHLGIWAVIWAYNLSFGGMICHSGVRFVILGHDLSFWGMISPLVVRSTLRGYNPSLWGDNLSYGDIYCQLAVWSVTRAYPVSGGIMCQFRGMICRMWV